MSGSSIDQSKLRGDLLSLPTNNRNLCLLYEVFDGCLEINFSGMGFQS